MSEINMTPLIDVMLVLLVIFMLTAPLMTSSLKLDLPKADAPPPPANKQPPTLSIVLTADGEMHLEDKVVKPDDLVQAGPGSARSTPTRRCNCVPIRRCLTVGWPI